MKVRAGLALVYWLLMLAAFVAIVVLGWRNAVAGLDNAVSLLALLAFGTVGPFIVLRRPEHLIGWLFCLDALLNTVASLSYEVVQYALVTRAVPLAGAEWLAWLASWAGDAGWALLFTFTFLLFPNGRLPSRRWRPMAWFVAAAILFHTVVTMFRPGPFEDWPGLSNPLGAAVPAAFLALDAALDFYIIAIIFVSVSSLVWRFRSVRGEERQQIKWIAYVTLVLLALFGIELATSLSGQATPAAFVFRVLFAVAFAAFPVAVGVSILRYRLWDIDLLIRRTLIYTVLTGALAFLYGGSTIVLQRAVGQATRADSQLVSIFSTLLIAAAFAPLRRRIQAGIDRRFYRRQVDAARTLAAFGAAARDQVDLERLTQALLDALAASFQPAHASLWLRRGAPDARREPLPPP